MRGNEGETEGENSREDEKEDEKGNEGNMRRVIPPSHTIERNYTFLN